MPLLSELIGWVEAVSQITQSHAMKGFKGQNSILKITPEVKQQAMLLAEQKC